MKPKQVSKKIDLSLGLANIVFAGSKLVMDLPSSNSTGPVDGSGQLRPYGPTKKMSFPCLQYRNRPSDRRELC